MAGVFGPGWRRFQALALLASVGLVLGSAAWHHEHPQARTVGCFGSHESLLGDGPRAHATSGAPDGAGTCPICLSQRMLGQTDVEGPVGFSAPNAGTPSPAPRCEPVPASFTDARTARAPPRV